MTMNAIRMENATLISTTSGMPCAPAAARFDAVLQRQEADHLTDRIAPRHHDQQADQHHRQGQRDVLARDRIGVGGDRQHHLQRQRHQADAGQHGDADADHGLDLAMDAEAEHDAAQRPGDQHRLEAERDAPR